MRRTAVAGNVRGFITSCFRKHCIHIIVSLLLSAADFRKRHTGNEQAQHMAEPRRYLLRVFCNYSRISPPQAPLWLLTILLIFVWCGTFYASSIPMLSFGRRCRLWVPTITFVETNLIVWLCSTIHRRKCFISMIDDCFARKEVCNTNKSCLGRNKPSCRICSLPPLTTLCA